MEAYSSLEKRVNHVFLKFFLEWITKKEFEETLPIENTVDKNLFKTFIKSKITII